MKIIIPMTGYGSRFVAAGYKELKPFISLSFNGLLKVCILMRKTSSSCVEKSIWIHCHI